MVKISIYMTIQYTYIYQYYKTIYLSLFECINIFLTSHLAFKVKLEASKQENEKCQKINPNSETHKIN